MTNWTPDLLGDPYEKTVLDLGNDPDGEGPITATLVRRRFEGTPRAALIYVHGFTDYFFHTPFAEFFADHGIAFYGLDLRKCGRSLDEAHTPHYVSDLSLYNAELDWAVAMVREETGADVIVSGHSTGGLIVPLWLDGTRPEGVIGAILNSPWFDLQGPAFARTGGTELAHAVSRVLPRTPLRLPETDAYGSSLHSSRFGEWEYDLGLKPLSGFPVTVGWLSAIRKGHARLHRGLDIGVPSLILRSARSRFSHHYDERRADADLVLDVRQIARWAGCVGNRVSVVPIEGARHDVFLSRQDARENAYREVEAWLAETLGS